MVEINESQGRVAGAGRAATNIFGRMVQDVLAVTMGWAQYGLVLGRQTLEASARTLESTAKMLGDLSVRLAGTVERASGRPEPSQT